MLARFGSESALGVAAGFALLKELGPVLTALLFAGRAGTSLASEIGLMRATDQLTAMQVMAVDPMRSVIAPRFLGGFIAMPLLVAIFDILGLFGTQLIGVSVMGVDSGTFWSQMQNALSASDVVEGIVKSWCSRGLHADGGVLRLQTPSPPPKASALPPRARSLPLR